MIKLSEQSDQVVNLSLDKQLCFSLYSASNAMGRVYRPLLDKLDLTYLQYIVMMVLWEHDSVSVKSLGEKVHLDSGTLTPLLKRLEAKGLVIRARSEHDERVRVISLSEQGVSLQQQAESVPQAMLCQADMPLEELQALKQGCDRLFAKLMK
ncbi:MULTISPECIES: MarR family winged helix-turn-helix transcriptional regulator [unclassified Agarivorans]|uniref:MarR family winged helix-turn-helix transcriptional regulator n=1 Tax=unclassified Agarivorans TaxID=2636026 RepID=UPI0026E1D07F|nr:MULTISPECIES: MarR family transcriptional regulator [unclassified Agarivorans]MDO6685566.1 MarR family transcriptional regulator [Agarivorans sp. 3_MG-2023]MDO6715952.1 MarR family transcriptional regulator [Agarivorans sp. 2_MG-2023]